VPKDGRSQKSEIRVQKAELGKRNTELRWQAILLLAAVAALVAVPPSLIERLPTVCLNRHVLGFCPACGSLRALVCLFHGAVGQALKYNPNCLLTAPVLVLLLLASLRRAAAGRQ
jgi:hypothetical protein